MRECCNGDDASQWRNPKFEPPPRSNPISDSHKSRQGWLHRGPLHLCKSLSRYVQGFRFCTCVTLRTKNMLVFLGGLATRYSQGPWTDFDAKYAKTRGSAQGCAFSGSQTQNLISRPPFPRISAILGTIFYGTWLFWTPRLRVTWYSTCATTKLPWSVMYSQMADLWYCKYLRNYNTDQHEIAGQYLDNENVSGDAALWRHIKSKMANGCHFEDR